MVRKIVFLFLFLLKLSFGLSAITKRSNNYNNNELSQSNKLKSLVINLDDIAKIEFSEYSKLMHLTVPEYRKYAAAKPGSEHYPLLSYFAKLLSKSHSPFIDIGTRVGTSALTLAAHGHPVVTYDLPDSNELLTAMSAIKRSKSQWLDEIKNLNCSITIQNVDILTLPSENFETIRRSSLILLDTFHKPYTTPFEREFLTKLSLTRFQGILLLDDIHENEEMNKWWNEIICSKYHSFNIYDLTSFGHATGTGLLDFTNRVEFVGNGVENIFVRSNDPKFKCEE